MAEKKDGRKFTVGDYVFAKMKWFPPWPSKIIGCINNKHVVYFYGTKNIAKVANENLFKYVGNEEKFVIAKHLKRSKFREGCAQIENAVNGVDDPADLADASCVTDDNDSDGTSPQKHSDAGAKQLKPPKKVKRANVSKANSKIGNAINVVDLTQMQITEGGATSLQNGSVANTNYKPRVDEKRPCTSQQAQAGLKKRTLQQETTGKKGKKDAKSATATATVNYNRTTHVDADSIVVPKLDNDAFIKVLQQLGCGMSVFPPIFDYCYMLLEQCQKFEVNKQPLLRNRECVDTIRRLCHYEGDWGFWVMNDKQKSEFSVQMEMIRDIAQIIFKKIRDVLADDIKVSDESRFWEEFSKLSR